MSNSKIDAHDLTVYPDHVKNYDQVQQYETFDNSEFDSEENHKRTIQGLRKLEKLNNKNGRNDLFIVVFNESSSDEKDTQPIRQLKTGMDQEQIYNFMFDYALTGLSTDDKLWIHYYIMKYRFISFDDNRNDQSWANKKMLAQVYFGMYLDKTQLAHIRGIWS